MSGMSLRNAAAGLVVLAVALVLAVRAESRPTWTPDGYNYGVHMLVYAGVPKNEATIVAQRFYSSSPVGEDPRYARYFKEQVPPYAWALFSPRVVYPLAASLLYRFRGMYSLIDVSAIAYVLSAIALYCVLLCFGSPLLAMLGTLGFALWPRVTTLAASDLTDMTALFFWTLTLMIGCRLVRSGERIWAVAFVPACILLSFTRPVPYLPFGAGIGVVTAAVSQKNTQAALAGVWMSIIALACAAALSVVLGAAHAPSFTYLLGLARDQPATTGAPNQEPLPVWFVRTVFGIMRAEIAHGIKAVLPILAILGSVLRRGHTCVPMLAGAAVFALVSILTNPIPNDTWRTFEIPLYPLIAAGLVLLADVVIGRFRASA